MNDDVKNDRSCKEDLPLTITHISECPFLKEILNEVNDDTGRTDKVCICRLRSGTRTTFDRCPLHKCNVIIRIGEVFHNS